ncbi:MAG: hypothetical protein KY464_12605 [Gemmatimonadetes bacterium]|nr:hypothetical protein [Gemmatimonadota bacterium]
MNRSQGAALGGVALLLAGAFALRAEREQPQAQPAPSAAPRVAALQAEHREEVDPRVHAREHGDLAARAGVAAGRRELVGA